MNIYPITEQEIIQLIRDFNIDGKYVGHTTFTNGLINTTERVTIEKDGKIKEYILQKINQNVFKSPEDVMENIANVTNFIRNKLKSKGERTSRRVMKFYTTRDGKYYTIDNNGDYWRLCKYINKSVAYDTTEDLRVLEETGKAFGQFQTMLSDYPVEDLNIIIPHFHNTLDRYRQLEEAVANDSVGRVDYVKEEIEEYLRLKKGATKLYRMQKEGKLQLRVTHNDTKCNNVLFDKDTGEYLCAIDLDTIMPGLACYDFGDAVRFAANTCAEDEVDISKVKLDIDKYDALAKGFVSTAGASLTQLEKDTLALGAITMTVECGSRFLADYLNGDVYFKTKYSQHNLDRARCQLALAQDMIANYSLMKDIVNKYSNQHISNT
jgi:hypothetical protein